MSGISSGIGLISGIDTAALIDQLISIERVPINNLKSRVDAIDAQRAAFLDLSARLLSVQNSVLAFGRASFFNSFSATSTNDKVLTATAGEGASPGSVTFRVHSLVSTHSVISRGFADADATPIGTGSISIEVGHGKVNPATALDALNGGLGVRRGVITITDRSGASADIDLSTALTMDDVLAAINTNTQINVRASVTGAVVGSATGDRIVIEDLSGGSGTLSVIDKDGGGTAADLGIATSVTAGRIDGSDLIRLSLQTSLSDLNDGNGVGRLGVGTDLVFTTGAGDFNVSLSEKLAAQLDTDLRILNSGNGVRLGVIRITDRSGQSADVDLTGATTARDIIDAINAADVAVSATVFGIDDESFFQIVDQSGATGDAAGNLIVEDVSGFAAADLGLAGSFDANSINGRNVYRIDTVGDLLNVINFAQGNDGKVEASIASDGNGLVLRSLVAGSAVTISAAAGSTAAQDLGLLDASFNDTADFQTRNLIAGLNTVLLRSLRGGAGVQAGTVRFTDQAGNTGVIDFTAAQTLQDVIDRINADTSTGFSASINASNNGIALRDLSGGSAGALSVVDETGTLAADLGIAVANDSANPFVGDKVNGSNAQLQYVSRQSLLADLNAGRGIRFGDIQITNSNGAVAVVSVDDSLKTTGDLIDRINSIAEATGTIHARINDNGDGILIEDTAGGPTALTITDVDGQAAADLRLKGKAKTGETSIDGSYEIRIEIGADDTLQDVVKNIAASGGAFSASILNHGGTQRPFSLALTSDISGRHGELVIDTSGIDLGFSTLSRAKDAVLTIGDDTAVSPLLVTGSSNTLDNVVQGVTLNLLSTSDQPVTISTAQDVNSIVDSVKSFVDGFNSVMDTIGRSTRFDPDTLERGILLGDSTVSLIRSRLTNVVLRKYEGADASVSRLFSIGLRLGSGGKLQFDEERFRKVYDETPDAVERLFTLADTGFADVSKQTIEDLTRDFDGVVSQKDKLLSDQQDLLNGRIDSLTVLLDAKRARLEAQFVALESSLAALQAQQNSLLSLAQLTGG